MRAGLDGLDGFTIERRPRVGASRRASRRCGTPRSRWSRSPTPASPPDDPALVRAADWLLGEEIRVPATGRCAGRGSSPAAGRSSSRTTTTPTSTTPPRSCWRCGASSIPTPARVDAAVARGGALDGRHAVPRRRLGRLRRRQHAHAADAAAVLRLRRGDRPAERRRHRARRRDARRPRPRPTRGDSPPASAGCCAAAGARRLVVRPLGREPRLRHRRGGARAASPAGVTADAARDPARGALAGDAPERRRRLGRGPALLRRPRRAGAGTRRRRRPRGRCSRAPAAGERSDATSAACGGWWRRSARTAPGTSRSSPAPASPATSTSTTTCTGWSSR